jgi:polysaccharide export outer membrane protein
VENVDLLKETAAKSEGKSMVRRTMARLMFAAVAVLWLTSCISGGVDPAYTALTDDTDQIESAPLGELGPGDKIKLRVYDEENLSGDFTVSEKGSINYPLVGRVQVEGLTCAELESRIGRKLKNGYLKKPSVSCTVVEYISKRIYVLGEVQAPGSFPYKANLTVVEAMSLAGGMTESARANASTLTRTVDGEKIKVTVPLGDIIRGRRENLQLKPGDILYIPQKLY